MPDQLVRAHLQGHSSLWQGAVGWQFCGCGLGKGILGSPGMENASGCGGCSWRGRGFLQGKMKILKKQCIL